MNNAGLECPACGCPETRVRWTRDRAMKVNGKMLGSRVRGRECAHCGEHFTTSERRNQDVALTTKDDRHDGR